MLARQLASVVEILRENLELGIKLQPVSHASRRLLASMRLGPGEFQKTEE